MGNQPTQLLPGPPFPPLQMRVIKLTCNDGGDENMNTECSTISSRRASFLPSTPSSRLCAPWPCTELPARGSDSRLPARSRFQLMRTPGLCVQRALALNSSTWRPGVGDPTSGTRSRQWGSGHSSPPSGERARRIPHPFQAIDLFWWQNIIFKN